MLKLKLAGILRVKFRFIIFTISSLVFVTFFTITGCKLMSSDEHMNNVTHQSNAGALDEAQPTVFIALFIRNKAHTLPYFLTLLQELDYPKDRISLWIRSDHNEDRTLEILTKWINLIKKSDSYHSISSQIIDTPPFRQIDQTKSSVQWTPKRFRHIIRLKEEALAAAKKIWADFIWFLDPDAFIINNQTLKHLTKKKKRIVAPMLVSGGLYSNFWAGMENYYYKRTDQYKKILDRKIIDCFQVPMVHTAVLMNLRYITLPDFQESKVKNINSSVPIPEDDIIRFAVNAKNMDIPLEICNDLEYGALLTPLEDEAELAQDFAQLHNLKIEAAAYWYPSMRVSNDLKQWIPPMDQDRALSTLGFDQVYLINLKRRPDRLEKMKNVLKILGIKYQIVEATDGKLLTMNQLVDLGVEPLSSYRDPYSKRVMTYGEIGCFLSHYRIWNDMVQNRHETALVLEDDIRFEPYFELQLHRLFQEVADLNLDWDLIYLGRKRPSNVTEPWVSGSNYIVELGYSYWTLGYVISSRGAMKLIDAKPLRKLIPVDEFLPVMYNRHSNQEWMSAFPTRNLKAFSAEPLLLYPTHYTGEIGHFSDTEESVILNISQAKNCSSKDEL